MPVVNPKPRKWVSANYCLKVTKVAHQWHVFAMRFETNKQLVMTVHLAGEAVGFTREQAIRQCVEMVRKVRRIGVVCDTPIIAAATNQKYRPRTMLRLVRS